MGAQTAGLVLEHNRPYVWYHTSFSTTSSNPMVDLSDVVRDIALQSSVSVRKMSCGGYADQALRSSVGMTRQKHCVGLPVRRVLDQWRGTGRR
jgi:hypothetical protein